MNAVSELLIEGDEADALLEEGLPSALAFHGERRGEVHGGGVVVFANEVAGSLEVRR